MFYKSERMTSCILISQTFTEANDNVFELPVNRYVCYTFIIIPHLLWYNIYRITFKGQYGISVID